MTPDEIIEAYNVLAQDVQDNTAQEAARIGNAQRSLGTLAERVASPSGQTYGLANYTYDRTMRPTVDSTSKALITQGLATGLETNLTNALRAAKSRYENARNSYATSGGNNNNSNDSTKEVTDPTYTGKNVPEKEYAQSIYEDFYNQYKRGEISEEEWYRIRMAFGGDAEGTESRQRNDLFEHYYEAYLNGEITAEEWERIKQGL